jgi:hypothetical protein
LSGSSTGSRPSNRLQAEGLIAGSALAAPRLFPLPQQRRVGRPRSASASPDAHPLSPTSDLHRSHDRLAARRRLPQRLGGRQHAAPRRRQRLARGWQGRGPTTRYGWTTPSSRSSAAARHALDTGSSEWELRRSMPMSSATIPPARYHATPMATAREGRSIRRARQQARARRRRFHARVICLAGSAGMPAFGESKGAGRAGACLRRWGVALRR